jgi:hypothetical protein
VVQFHLLLSNRPNYHAARIRFYNYDKKEDDDKKISKRSIESDFPANLVSSLTMTTFMNKDCIR